MVQLPSPDLLDTVEDATFDLDAVDSIIPAAVQTDLAANELGTLAGAYLEDDAQALSEMLKAGDDSKYREAIAAMGQDFYNEAMFQADQRITEAQTPEEVQRVIEETKVTLDNGFTPIKEFRKNWVVKNTNVSQDMLPRIDTLVAESYMVAAEALKREQQLWKDASILNVLGDLGEIILPHGFVEEEVFKFNNGMDDALDKIAEAGSVEEQKAALNALVDDWVNSETMLLSNNNSLFTAEQISYLKESILDGGLARIDGQITDAQLERHVMTGINVGFGVLEVAGIKGLFRFLKSRVFPTSPQSWDIDEARTILEGEWLGPAGTLATQGTELSTRSATSAKHTQYVIDPQKLLRDDRETGLLEVMGQHGVPPEKAAMEHIPTPTPYTDIGFPDNFQDRSNITSLILSDESLTTMGQKRAMELEEYTGGTLRNIPSASGFKGASGFRADEEIEDSFGVFTYLFGNRDTKGFETPEAATRAANGNFMGEDWEVVAKNGQYYVQVEQRHYLDPLKDVTDFGDNTGVRMVSTAYLNPLRQLGDDVLKGVFALKQQNRVLSGDLEKKLRTSVTGMNPNEARTMYKALEKGESEMVEWNTYREFLDANGLVPSKTSQKVWEKYRGVREVMNDVYEIRNKVFTSAKRSLGYKNVDLGDDNFELGRRVFGDDVKSSHVYDTSRQTLVSKADLPEDAVVMKLDNAIETPEGLRSYILVQPEKVHKLPPKLLNKRPGHIDRMYRDAGWTVKTTKSRVVDDVTETYESTTHIVKTKKEADAIVARLVEDDSTQARSVAARENSDIDQIYNDTNSVQFTYGASHTRKRNDELLLGSDGARAPLLDVEDRLQAAVRSAGKTYDVDIVNSLKSRFYNHFSDMLPQGKATPWDNDLGRMVKSKRDWTDEAYNTAKQWHNYIRTFESIENGKVFKAIDTGLAELSRNAWKPDTQAVSSKVQKYTSQVYIVGAPLFQIPQNLTQLLYVGMRHPISGTAAAAQTPFVISHLAGIAEDTKLLSKALGVDEAVTKDLLDTIKKSGLLEVGRADDFLSMTRAAMGASSRTQAGKLWGGVKATAGAPFRVSQLAQENTVKLVNLVAYLAEFNKQVVRQGKKYNSATKASISFEAQKVTNTQNGIDQFWYQNKASVFSTALQFAQHMNKVFFDVVADPIVKVGTLGKKNLGRSRGPLSETFGRAAFTLGTTIAIFGFDGLLGQVAGGDVEDILRKRFPDAIDAELEFLVEGGFFNTMINGTLKYAFGGEGAGDFTARMGPAGFADYINDKIVNDFMTLDMAGPAGSAVSKLVDFGVNSWEVLNHPEMDTPDKVSTAVRELAAVVKGFSDYEKAVVAANMQNWPYWGTLSSPMYVTEYEGALAVLGIPPQMVQDAMENMDFSGRKSTSDLDRTLKLFLRQSNAGLAREAENGTIDERRSLEIQQKWLSYVVAISDPSEREYIYSEWTKNSLTSQTKNYESYIKPYIDSSDVTDYITELTALRGKATTEEARRQIDERLEFYKRLDTNNEELYK